MGSTPPPKDEPPSEVADLASPPDATFRSPTVLLCLSCDVILELDEVRICTRCREASPIRTLVGMLQGAEPGEEEGPETLDDPMRHVAERDEGRDP